MSADLAPQLRAWLAATDIVWLELRGPAVHLCLRNEAGQVEAVAPEQALRASRAALPVIARSVGVFLHRHPLHDAPLAAPGQSVAAGQVIGLLRIGSLLLPVAAPLDGIVDSYLVANGTAVGYGSHVANVIPTTPA